VNRALLAALNDRHGGSGFDFANAAGAAGGVAPLDDGAMDLTNVRVSTADKALVMQLTVAAYANRPKHAAGNRYQVEFNVGGKAVEVYWKDGPARAQEANAFYQQRVRVDGEFKHDVVTGSVKGDVVTMVVKLAMLKSAVGAKVEGVRAENVAASALSSYVAQNFRWDEAVGPESGFVVGGACR
jgi:hypothetical protein